MPTDGVRPVRALTGIRALAALWVLLHHFRPASAGYLPPFAMRFLDAGFLGVDIFFVLSGFIIAYNYTERLARPAEGARWNYAVARVARIYPVHLTVWIAYGAITALLLLAGSSLKIAQDGPASWLSGVAMTQGFTNLGAWNAPAWSISFELLGYMAFPFIARPIASIRKASAGFAFAAGSVGLGVVGMWLIQANDGYAANAHDVLTLTAGPLPYLRIACEFVAGALVYAGWRRLAVSNGNRFDALAVLAALGVLVVACSAGASGLLLTIPLIALFILGCAGSTGLVARILGARPTVWLGRVSYSLYMVHYLVLVIANKAFKSVGLFPTSAPVFAADFLVFFCASVLVAWACFRFVEEPCRHWLVRVLSVADSPPARTSDAVSAAS